MTTDLRAFSDREIDEIWNRGQIDRVDELYALDTVDHSLVPGCPPGREGIKVLVRGLRAAFPDLRFTIDVTVVEGERIARRWTMRGTHRGVFLGIPATGLSVVMTGIDLLRVVGDRVQEIWHNEDIAGLMQQLEAAP